MTLGHADLKDQIRRTTNTRMCDLFVVSSDDPDTFQSTRKYECFWRSFNSEAVFWFRYLNAARASHDHSFWQCAMLHVLFFVMRVLYALLSSC